MRYNFFNKLDFLNSLDIKSDNFFSSDNKNENLLSFRNNPFIFTLSHSEFGMFCRSNGFTDDNIEELKDRIVLISILGGNKKDVWYREHHFIENHSNVLNINFDDITEETHGYKMMTERQAEKAVKFIKNNSENHNNKIFINHCFAGISRSGAFSLTMTEHFGYDKDMFYSKNEQVFPNSHVIYMLRSKGLFPKIKQ
jgi:predicted protein tyrosine phosphatase